jgi:hypothetical protein
MSGVRNRRSVAIRSKRGMSQVRSTFIIVAAAFLLALPSAALAQGGYGPSNGVLGEEESGGGSAPASGGGTSPNGGKSAPAAAPVPATVESGTDTGGGGQLPFTGADLLVVAAIGMALVGAGVGLRRMRDTP